MTTDEIRQTVLQILGEIAPEADLARIKPEVDFRDQLDLDSMDALNFIIGVDKALGVEIPETDYARTATLDDFVAYLAERLQAPAVA